MIISVRQECDNICDTARDTVHLLDLSLIRSMLAKPSTAEEDPCGDFVRFPAVRKPITFVYLSEVLLYYTSTGPDFTIRRDFYCRRRSRSTPKAKLYASISRTSNRDTNCLRIARRERLRTRAPSSPLKNSDPPPFVRRTNDTRLRGRPRFRCLARRTSLIVGGCNLRGTSRSRGSPRPGTRSRSRDATRGKLGEKSFYFGGRGIDFLPHPALASPLARRRPSFSILS